MYAALIFCYNGGMDFSRPDNARKINRLKVLSVLRRRDISRAELSRELLINKVSISEIIDGLMKEGLIVSGPLDNTTSGRPATILSIDKNGGRVFSLVFSSSNVMASASDLKGNVLRYERFPRDENIVEYLSSFITKMTQDNPRVYGMTVIGTEEDIPRDVFPWPVIYKGRAEAQAKGEAEGRTDLSPDTLFVSWGDEIEACWMKGEALSIPSFGHMKVTKGIKCRCGGDGCLEAVASGLVLKEKTGITQYRRLTTEEKGLIAIDDASSALSFALSEAVQATGAKDVVIMGEVSGMPKDLYASMEDKMKMALPPERRSVRILKSEKAEKALLEGAGIIALEEFFYHSNILRKLEEIQLSSSSL